MAKKKVARKATRRKDRKGNSGNGANLGFEATLWAGTCIITGAWRMYAAPPIGRSGEGVCPLRAASTIKPVLRRTVALRFDGRRNQEQRDRVMVISAAASHVTVERHAALLLPRRVASPVQPAGHPAPGTLPHIVNCERSTACVEGPIPGTSV